MAEQAPLITGPYQDVDSRTLLPNIDELGIRPVTNGAKEYFRGGPVPPNTDQDAWREIWAITRQLTEHQERQAQQPHIAEVFPGNSTVSLGGLGQSGAITASAQAAPRRQRR